MVETAENSKSQKIKYINFKNDESKQTAEITIPPTNDKNETTREKRSFVFKPSLKFIAIFTVIFILIVVSCTLYFKTVPKDVILTKIYNSENTLDEEHSGVQSNNGSTSICVPIKDVENVVVVGFETDESDSLCYDNATCHLLLQKIEEDQNGLKYNFVIGSGGELYVGLGFKCLSNVSENVLYIKVLALELGSLNEQCSRINEVINEGVSCGFISKNVTVVKMWQNYHGGVHDNIATEFCPTSNNFHEYSKNRTLHHHNPIYEKSTLIHRDIKWSVCGNLLQPSVVVKSRVIILERSPHSVCLPLEHVDEIVVDVVETDHLNCSNSSCVDVFEEQHDGLHFNFIIAHNYDVYVGLGFRCRADNTSTALRIKVLEPYHSTHIPHFGKSRKLLDILEEGIVCGKILENYHITANCHTEDSGKENACKHPYELFNRYDYRLDIHLAIAISKLGEERYNITSEHGRGVVPSQFRFSYCTKDSTTAAPESTTELESNSYPVYDESSSEYDIQTYS